MRVPADVIQNSIDDSLKQASPFYESIARPYIPGLEDAIEKALMNEGYTIIPTAELERLKLIEKAAVKRFGMIDEK